MSAENPFDSLRKEHETAMEGIPQEGYFMFDAHGIPHFGASKEDAAEKMRQANEGYQ